MRWPDSKFETEKAEPASKTHTITHKEGVSYRVKLRVYLCSIRQKCFIDIHTLVKYLFSL